MKIALVFPPFFLEPMYNMPPLGLINLATALKSSPHQTVILDFPQEIRRKTLVQGERIYDDCAERILAEKPDVAGFSLQCTTYPPGIQIARRVKERAPWVKVVFGGHNASFADERTLALHPFVDAVVRGEGEETFPELVGAYDRGDDESAVPGTTSRRGGRIIRNPDRELIPDLDRLPLADYSLVAPLAEYRDACDLKRSIAILEVGRGCPHRCIYCSQSLLWQRKTRTFSIDRLVGEMRHIHEDFGAECFLLAYDQFTARRNFVEEFCKRVIDEKLNHLPWYCISRLDSVDAHLLSLMREAGCESMCYGIDSGSRRTLAFIRKNIDREILYQRVMETTDQGIVPTLSYVIGFPEEEKEDIDATLTLALQTGALGNNNPLIQMTTTLPGTDLHIRYRDRLVREVDTYFSLGIEFNEGRRLQSDDELIDSDPELFSSFYNLPCPAYPLKDLNLLATYFPIIVNLYPRSFLLLTMERGESASGLFFRFLSRISEKLGRSEPSLSPRECFEHFNAFAEESLAAGDAALKIAHIRDVLKYETSAIEAGKFDAADSPFSIDLHGINGFKPVKSRKILLEEFTFRIPDIILDFKSGIFDGTYPEGEAFLVFRQEGDQLDVKEINRFGVDFLGLCNGERSLDSISAELYDRYGEGLSLSAFRELCVEAVLSLGRMNLLQEEQSKFDLEGR